MATEEAKPDPSPLHWELTAVALGRAAEMYRPKREARKSLGPTGLPYSSLTPTRAVKVPLAVRGEAVSTNANAEMLGGPATTLRLAGLPATSAPAQVT